MKKPKKDELSKTELELTAEQAKRELEEYLARVKKEEWNNYLRSIRQQVLDFVDANPHLPLSEVAEKFGIKEYTIRAWKAHRTMGTYNKQKKPKKEKTQEEEPLFHLNKKLQRKAGFVLRRRYSKFIHYFDKTPAGIVCPHFYILAFANGCIFKCDYCYLKLTLRHWPKPTVFSNTARMFQEIRHWLYATEKPSVLNAGELADSLVWDSEIKLTPNLVPLFAQQKKHKLLLLSKSVNVSELAKLEPTPQVIVSFSLNAPKVAERYERKAPPPEKRLSVADYLKNLGWNLRLRIDPIIPIPSWQEAYKGLIEEINEIQPETVTLGTLRYFPNLPQYTSRKEVFKYAVDEKDPDGRYRLPFAQRLEIYQYFLDLLKVKKIGLCKETEKIHQALGLSGNAQSCNCSYD